MKTTDDALPLPPQPDPDGRPLLYVVNSNPEFLDLIRELLADIKLRVVVEQLRPNPEVTLDNFRTARPDLLLLDYVPFMADAETLLTALSESGDLRALPVLLASTSSRAAGELAHRFPDQVVDVLPKPFELDNLYQLIGQHIGVVTP